MSEAKEVRISLSERQIVRSMTQHVLDNAYKHEWSIQGFGMLRTYLPFGMRMNIWNSRFAVRNVSRIHTHPWHFDSYVERGMLHNRRFLIAGGEKLYDHAVIKPGPNGGITEELGRVCLTAQLWETYQEGSVYRQEADEIHMSNPRDGCITINLRARIDPDEALVFWPHGEEWVSAEPRKATYEEIAEFVSVAKAEGRA